ncbi:MAG: hypothetical protein IKZ90_00805 [Clostridiales bacterium]|nr:hypothetical protein [Clostridiales bacterium]
MKRDIIGDIFLGGVLLSLLFLFSFPAYFCYTANVPREISLPETIMSLCFVAALILTCIWFCWKKKVWVMLGVASFGLLAYIPKWFLPKVNLNIVMNGKSLVDSILSMALNRIYELTHAPFAGLIGIVPEKTADGLTYTILPIAVISYILAQIVRFYHNAYVTEKKQIHDFAHFRKINEVRAPSFSPELESEGPSPLGTIVLNEKAEVAKETFPVKKADNDATVANVLTSETPAGHIGSGEQDTSVIALAAHAPTSAPTEETKVIALAAHAPTSTPASAQLTAPAEDTSVIELSAHAPTSAPTEETRVIELSAHAPTSALSEEEKDEGKEETPSEVEEKLPEDAPVKEEATQESAELDFPDVHGEAEKIDVFGDDE